MENVAGNFSRLRPEHRVLISAISRKPRAMDQLRAAWSSELDCRLLRQEALHHGIFPSVYRCLAEAGLEGANPECFRQIQELYRHNARRSLKLIGELLKILALLEGEGIAAVPFKGPVLAALAYGDPTLRYFVDLDILVPPQDARRAQELLLARGFTPYPPLSPRQELAQLRHSFEFGLVNKQLTRVEIHWRFAEKLLTRAPEPEEAMARRTQIDLAGQPVPSLAPGDLLLVLCVHGISHLWLTLGLINDVAHLLESQGPWDWDHLWQRASDSGLQRILLLGVSLAHEVLGAPLSEEILCRIEAEPAVTVLRLEAMTRLFTEKVGRSGFTDRVRFQVRARERFRDRLSYLWISLVYPTKEDWHWLPLPDRLYWLYYILRPMRLLLHRIILREDRRINPSQNKPVR